MKTFSIYTFLLLMLTASFCLAQRKQQYLGLYFAPNHISEKHTNINTNGIGGGFFYEYHFSMGESLRINLNWVKLRKERGNYNNPSFGTLTNDVDIAEILFLLRMRFISTKTEKLQAAILAGYGIGQVVSTGEIYDYPGGYSVSRAIYIDFDKTVHSANIGLELRYLISGKCIASLGGLYKITRIDSVPGNFGEVNIWNLLIGFGMRI